MTALRLLTLPQAAQALGVPEASLLREAEAHGHLIRIGRAVRIAESELWEIVEKCRSTPRAPASTSSASPAAPPSGSSATPAVQSAARAQQIAERLKRISPPTSRASTAAEVVPITRPR